VKEKHEPKALGLSAPPAAIRRTPVLLPALLSAGLLWFSFFPVNAGWLAWVALVPLLFLVRSNARRWRIYLGALLFGVVFFFSAIHWLEYADDREIFKVEWSEPAWTINLLSSLGMEPPLVLRGGHLTWSSLATYCAAYLPVAIFLLRVLDRRTRLPLTLTLPVVWTPLEYIRAHFGTGFPWYFLGHTQHGFLPLLQLADLGGAYLLTFLVAAVNGAVFELLAASPQLHTWLRLPERTSFVSPRAQAIAVGSVLVLALIYGCCRLGQENFQAGPRIALIQGNFPQSLRNVASFTDDERNAANKSSEDHFNELADEALRQEPDLIVWPETSAAFAWYALADGQPEDYSIGKAMSSLQRWPTHLLIGTNAYNAPEPPGTRSTPFNSAILISPRVNPYAGRYDKIHRVPFGEYVPLRDTCAKQYLDVLAPYDFDYSIDPGGALTRFPLGRYRFGVLICFEDSDPLLARQYVRDAPPLLDGLTQFISGVMYGNALSERDAPSVDFLLNLSNDAWFLGSSEHDEHLAISRFRAVECRRSVARAVNMGISAVIDGSGRVVALPGDGWAGSKKMKGVLTASIPLDDRHSLYAVVGDWLPALCLVSLVGALTLAIIRRRRESLPMGHGL
jgi:apolipoprotein N-acyltransferase